MLPAITGLAAPALRFDVDAAEAAYDAWKFSCGPAAICGLLSMTPAELRPHVGDFPQKGYTSPTMMYEMLRSLGARFAIRQGTTDGKHQPPWPSFGLARIQFGGPWCKPGVPMRVRYNYTHWVASWRASHDADRHFVYDINTTCAGWLGFFEWSHKVMPWLLEDVRRADRTWWVTHALEVSR